MEKGKFVIVDFRNMDYMKDKDGNISVYDTQEQASDVCGIYEFENAWVCELRHNHREELLKQDVIKKVCIHCEKPKEVRRIDGSYWCKDCRKGW